MSAPEQPLANAQRLSDAQFIHLSQQALARVETACDAWLQADVVDIDTHRTGGLLELSLPAGRGKIVINTQPPLHELWLAAKAGGHHFRWQGQHWCDTRDGVEFFARLSALASQQCGQPLQF